MALQELQLINKKIHSLNTYDKIIQLLPDIKNDINNYNNIIQECKYIIKNMKLCETFITNVQKIQKYFKSDKYPFFEEMLKNVIKCEFNCIYNDPDKIKNTIELVSDDLFLYYHLNREGENLNACELKFSIKNINKFIENIKDISEITITITAGFYEEQDFIHHNLTTQQSRKDETFGYKYRYYINFINYTETEFLDKINNSILYEFIKNVLNNFYEIESNENCGFDFY